MNHELLLAGDPFALAGLILIGSLASVWLVAICVRRFEIGVMLVVLSPFLSAVFVTHEDFATETGTTMGSYMRVGLLALVGCAGIYKYLQRRAITGNAMPVQFKLMGLFCLLALVSTGYSIDPFFTLIRSVSFTTLFGFLLGLYAWLDDPQKLDRTINTVIIVVTLILLVNVAALPLFGERVWYRGGSRFAGLWGSPNTFGMFALASYPFLFWKHGRGTSHEKHIIAALVAVLFVLQLLTGSRGTLAAVFIGLVVWLIVMKRPVKLLLATVVVGFLGLALLQTSEVRALFERETNIGTSLTTLNQRGEMWLGAIVLIGEKPLNGYGYGVGGKVWEDPRFNRPDQVLFKGSPRTSLHSGYISTLISVGLLGFVVWLVMILRPFVRSSKLPSSDYKALLVSTAVMCLALSFTEGVIGADTAGGIPFWIAWVMAERLYQITNCVSESESGHPAL